jgi:Uma2 family endonuclease
VSDVVVAVEIASSASQRTDRVAKRSDYADAGIPHYWIVDLDPLSVLECRLGADGAYADQGAVTGAFRTLEPFAIEVDLDALV